MVRNGRCESCDWILECISSSYSSVLINGSPSSEFKSFRGLRLGDPPSPFLLNILLERARSCGLIRGVQVGRNGMIISHLQFADDAILFCNNDRNEILNIKRILRYFQLLSGLKINFSKSMLCGIKIND